MEKKDIPDDVEETAWVGDEEDESCVYFNNLMTVINPQYDYGSREENENVSDIEWHRGKQQPPS